MEISERTFGGYYFIVAITAIVILIIMWYLVDRLDKEIINAERAQFELRLSEIRSTILLMQASLVAKDEVALAAKYQDTNPMDWMEPGQDRYLGEMSLEPSDDKKGNWVFEPRQKVIAYLPNALKWKADDGEYSGSWLRFRVAVIWSNTEEQITKKAKGLKLEPLQTVQWAN